MQDWAQTWAVTEVFAIPSAALNDDRIGRALDAIAPQLEQIVGPVGAQAIAAFGVEVAPVALKRHLANVVHRAMVADAQALQATPTPTA